MVCAVPGQRQRPTGGNGRVRSPLAIPEPAGEFVQLAEPPSSVPSLNSSATSRMDALLRPRRPLGSTRSASGAAAPSRGMSLRPAKSCAWIPSGCRRAATLAVDSPRLAHACNKRPSPLPLPAVQASHGRAHRATHILAASVHSSADESEVQIAGIRVGIRERRVPAPASPACPASESLRHASCDQLDTLNGAWSGAQPCACPSIASVASAHPEARTPM